MEPYRIRCPICNKYGSREHALNLCRKCEAEGKQPKCIVSRCNQDAVVNGKLVNRYCRDHLGDDNYSIRRDTPETPANDPKKGWRQERPKEYMIVREDFPISER